MLLKVIKHEFLANIKVLWIIYAGSFGLCLITGLFMSPITNSLNPYALSFYGVMTFLSSLGVGAVVLGTVIVLCQRFGRSITGKEAYFTFLLPVKNYVHILSRVLIALIFALFAAVVLIVDLMFLIGIGNLSTLFGLLNNPAAIFSVIMFIFCSVFVGIAVLVIQVYAAMSFGTVLTKNKAGGIFLALFIFSASSNIIMSFLSVPFGLLINNFFLYMLVGVISFDAALWQVFFIFFAVQAAYAGIYYTISWAIHCRHLRIGGQ